MTEQLVRIQQTHAYIVEVRFEHDGAENWQPMAQGVGLAQDLMVEWHLAWTNK